VAGRAVPRPRAAILTASTGIEPAMQTTVGASDRPPRRPGVLIVNADDWGRDEWTTASTLACVDRRSVSSVSAMVFMADSERAAAIARERGIDAGLHLNLTTPFSGAGCPVRLAEHQGRLQRYLLRHRLSQVLFQPGLARSCEYVVMAQRDEFSRLYGSECARIDGHHHMHLAANVLLSRLLPHGAIVRRSFSFSPGEKSRANRLYRRAVDALLARRYRLVDFFFSLAPLDPPSRLERIFSLARTSAVEVETHPVEDREYRFLAEGEIARRARDVRIASGFAVDGARL
jgi:hypothetical protein